MRAAGLEPGAVARAAGLAPERLGAARPSVTAAELTALFDAIHAPPRDPAFGLALGAAIAPELFGVVGLAMLTAPTYGAAIDRCARYKRLASDLAVDVWPIPGGGARVRVALPGGEGPTARGRVDTELAYLVSFGRRMASPPVAPREVRLSVRPRAPAPYRAFFACDVAFGADADELVLGPEALAAPLVGADEELHALVSGSAERALDATDDRLTRRARAAIAARLSDGVPSLDQVARALGTSARSLQRHLRAEGSSYSALVDATRAELARRYLRRDRMAPAEASFLLGFAGPGSFHRAFRRWTGQTPDAYRREGAHLGSERRSGD